ncbi:MAG: methyltransferase domain-containing protein [Lewinellaceae bacterium]|nr:methyltransferase domain-containing protein [Saprospiraceae bacterium]MCB9342152.1 methyltransferase domain-containing protein [Lewinellaceae bacterium]
MNFKLLFPTFRNRFLFVRSRLKKYANFGTETVKGLNLGTGEGDYDRMIAGYCTELIGCDVNEEDLQHARSLNAGLMNLSYELNDALNLNYEDNSFDLIVSCEVIEHVGKPDKMVQEMHRVMKPGAVAIMTFPSREFPVTYDPVNRIWQLVKGDGSKEFAISQGAYAFGHDYLIGSADFKKWASECGFELIEFRGLSRHLVGLLEMYWTGIAQSIFKKNAKNLTEDSKGGLKVRPSSTKDPALAIITDLILAIDQILFGWTNRSVGKGIVLKKPK